MKDAMKCKGTYLLAFGEQLTNNYQAHSQTVRYFQRNVPNLYF